MLAEVSAFEDFWWSILKIMLVLMALWTIEPISKRFRPSIPDYEMTDFMYLSNMAAVYAAIAILAGILCSAHPALSRLHAFAVPTATVLSTVVAAVFWGLFFAKRSLVTRTNTDPGVWPVLCECPKHMFPLLALALDHAGAPFPKTASQRVFLCAFGVVYYLVCEALVYCGIYLYPFLEHLTSWRRCGVFLSIMLVAALFYEVLYYQELASSI